MKDVIELDSIILSAHDKLDLSIYYFYLWKHKNSIEFLNLAHSYFNEFVQSVKPVKNKDLAISGVKIIYMLRENLIEGDACEVLSDFDDILYKYSMESELNECVLQFYLWCLLYFTERLESQTLKRDDNFVFQNLCMRLIEFCYTELQKSIYKEHIIFNLENEVPFFLFIISKILRLGFYNIRIVKILSEFSNSLLSYIPTLNSNKLHLLWAIATINKVVIIKGWENHISLLKSTIDFNEICKRELKDRNIFLQKGALGIYWLSQNISNILNIFDDKEFENFQNALLCKIGNSEVWSLIEKNTAYKSNHIGLFNGIVGVRILLNDLL